LLEIAEVAAADKESSIVTFLLSPDDAAKVTGRANRQISISAVEVSEALPVRLTHSFPIEG